MNLKWESQFKEHKYFIKLRAYFVAKRNVKEIIFGKWSIVLYDTFLRLYATRVGRKNKTKRKTEKERKK
jgi:hypothetical protein